MSAKPIVLVTGANGYIAGPVIEAFLKAGYAVRGTVRSKDSASSLVEALSEYQNDLEIVEVPDIIAPGAFDAAVKGVQAIAHLASPVSLTFTDPDPVLKTALEGTRGVLESALGESSVKSFVLMSSIAAISSPKPGPHVFTEADWNQTPELVQKLGKNSPGNLIYAASKTVAERALWEFRNEKGPSFTTTAINPTFVMGPPVGLDSVSKISGTTAFIWKVFSGQDIPAPLTETPSYIDVRDVARAFVFAVDHPTKADNQRYILDKGIVLPQAAADILRESNPNRREIIKEGTPGAGYTPDFSYPEGRGIDGSKIIKATGQDHYTVQQSIIDTAKYLEKFL